MDTLESISFKVTPSEMSAMQHRAHENGFESVASFMKLVALRSSKYKVTAEKSTVEKQSQSITIKVTAEQKEIMEKKAKEGDSEDLVTYLKFITLNAVVTVTVEVRSSGKLDSMLERIAKSRK